MVPCIYCLKRPRSDNSDLACDWCDHFMDKGIILISYSTTLTTDPKDPFRTGGWMVVSEDRIRQFLFGQQLKDVLYERALFIDDETWERLNLGAFNRREAAH